MADIKIIHGDCLDVMAGMDANSIDAIVTDPPYGIHFMGKDWDDFGGPLGIDTRTTSERGGAMHAGTYDTSRNLEFQEFMCKVSIEMIRVAKPGAHLLIFGSTRTHHRLMCGIEDAGWEIRDVIMWVFGSGFPKSLDVSKAIDKAAGAEREVVGKSKTSVGPAMSEERIFWGSSKTWETKTWKTANNITTPVTDAARQWAGFGTALKPAWEPIIVARKPLDGTVANNVLKYGTGALNIDACRVEAGERPLREHTHRNGNIYGGGLEGSKAIGTTTAGRWPANLVLSYPEDSYILRDNVTPKQLRQLAEWMDENAEL